MHLSICTSRCTCASILSPTVETNTITIPDLVSHCTLELHLNVNCKEASRLSLRWLLQYAEASKERRAAFRGLRAGLLTSMCYPNAPYAQLKTCCDFMNFLFHMDDLTDDMDTRGARTVRNEVMGVLYQPKSFKTSARVGDMTRDYWKRIVTTAAPGTQRRFIQTLDAFFRAVAQQADDRKHGQVPDLESYVTLRRDTSGCRPCWALIEYANNLNLPDDVAEHPVLRDLGDAANDLVTWSNDIFSYNVEQARGDTHNMIAINMLHRGLPVQDAVDFVGEMCKQSIDHFVAGRENLPSWGPEIDRSVQTYVEGLADWIVGSLHWTFESERYFGKKGQNVKVTRTVRLLPRLPVEPTSRP